MSRLFIIAVTAGLFLTGSIVLTPTSAQAETPSLENKKRASELYREGQRLFAQELYGAALEAFQKANKLFPAPANLYNIAKCHERLGQSDACVAGYEAYVKSYKELRGTKPPDMNDILHAVAKCRIGMRVIMTLNSNPQGASVALNAPDKLIGQTPLEVPLEPGTHTLFLTLDGFQPVERKVEVIPGRPFQLDLEMATELTITVETQPPGATVAIDATKGVVGQTPLTIRRDPGNYRLFVSLDGHQPLDVNVDLRPGDPVRLFFKLEPARQVGQIRLTSNIKRAAIFIDGKNVGLTPYDDPIEVSVGSHQITLTRDGYTSVSSEIQVSEGERVDFLGELWLRDPPTTWKGYLGWTGVGLGVASVVGGYVLGTQVDQQILYRGTPDFEAYKMYQGALYGAGGGLVALGAFLAILEGLDSEQIDDEDAAAVDITPTFHLTGAGLRGSF